MYMIHIKVAVLTDRILSQFLVHFLKHFVFTDTLSDNADFAL